MRTTLKKTFILLMLLQGCKNIPDKNSQASDTLHNSIKDTTGMWAGIPESSVKEKSVDPYDKLLNDLERNEKENNSIIGDSIVGTLYGTKYIFVVLNVRQKEGLSEKYDNVIVCSQIEKIEEIDTDLRYKILDQVQNSYLENAMRNYDKGKILKRRIFAFSIYSDASKERSKYLDK